MKPAPTIPSFYAAAMQNIDPVWFKRFEKLGLNIILLHVKSHSESPVHRYPELEKTLGTELEKLGVGYLDAVHYPGALNSADTGYWWWFFHCRDLAQAMNCLKSQLETRELLGAVAIFHSEQAGVFRCWWSYDSSAIGKLTTEEASA